MLLLKILVMYQVCSFELAHNLILKRWLKNGFSYNFALYSLLCDPLSLHLEPRWYLALAHGCHLVLRTSPSEGLISELLLTSLASEG